MNDTEATTARYFALSIKGGYYCETGEIVEDFRKAKLFLASDEAIAFRQKYDGLHKVTEATLLTVQVIISWFED